MVSGNITSGIRSVMSDIEHYLVRPFYKEDLSATKNSHQQKGLLESICGEKKTLKQCLNSIHLISSTLDPKEVLYFVVSKIAEIINVTRCSIVSIPLRRKKHAYVISIFENPKIINLKIDFLKNILR